MKNGLLAAVAAGLLLAAACDESEPALLEVYNATPNQVTSLTLSGPEETGNLLDAPVAPGEVARPSTGVEAGTYTWRIEYGGGAGLATYYDSADWGVEIELFPGRNTLKLQEGGGGL
jgi:hypothetical protein